MSTSFVACVNSKTKELTDCRIVPDKEADNLLGVYRKKYKSKRRFEETELSDILWIESDKYDFIQQVLSKGETASDIIKQHEWKVRS